MAVQRGLIALFFVLFLGAVAAATPCSYYEEQMEKYSGYYAKYSNKATTFKNTAIDYETHNVGSASRCLYYENKADRYHTKWIFQNSKYRLYGDATAKYLADKFEKNEKYYDKKAEDCYNKTAAKYRKIAAGYDKLAQKYNKYYTNYRDSFNECKGIPKDSDPEYIPIEFEQDIYIFNNWQCLKQGTTVFCTKVENNSRTVYVDGLRIVLPVSVRYQEWRNGCHPYTCNSRHREHNWFFGQDLKRCVVGKDYETGKTFRFCGENAVKQAIPVVATGTAAAVMGTAALNLYLSFGR